MSPGRAHRLWRVGKTPGAAQAPTKAYCELATTTTDAGRAEPGMGFRLRVRCLCGRPSAQVPDGGGRIHEGRLGDRSRRSYPIGARDQVLSRLVSERGAPKHLRSDNGPEFVSRALLKWIADQGIDTALIEPGKPWQNGVNESFNGKFRDECLKSRMVPLPEPRPRSSSKTGAGTSTPCGRIRASTIRHRPNSPPSSRSRLQRPYRQRAGTLRYMGPSRPGPLLNRPAKDIKENTSKGSRLKLKLVRRNRAGHTNLLHSAGARLYGKC